MSTRHLFGMVVLSVICFMPANGLAQYVTFNHDASVMNQFTIGETGAGSFTPDLYYDALHKNYRNEAMMTNKQFFRTEMKMSLNKQEPYAEALDSALNERKRVEFKNIADRTPGVTDVAWQVERGKVEGKLDILKKNIERITMEGGSIQSYREWLERYNAINCGIQAVRDAYMPQGARKEQYIAIYKDILLKNTEVCEYINYLRSLKEVKNGRYSSRRLPRTDFARIARSSHGRWKIALAAGSGGTGDSGEESAWDRYQRLLEETKNKH